MANFCNFDIFLRGKRGNVILVYNSFASYNGVDVLYAGGTDTYYEAHIQGSCAWSVNYNVTDQWDGAEASQDLNRLSENKLRKLGEQCTGYSLRAKSRVLQCDIMAHYWSEETGFDHFEYFSKGNLIKKRRIAFDYSNRFDWKTMEYIGHEGEFDESEISEEESLIYALMLSVDMQSVEPEEGDAPEKIQGKEFVKTITTEDGTVYSVYKDAEEDDVIFTREITGKAVLNEAVTLNIPKDVSCIEKKKKNNEISFELNWTQEQSGDSEAQTIKCLLFNSSLDGDSSVVAGSHIEMLEQYVKDQGHAEYIKLGGACPVLICAYKCPLRIGGKVWSQAVLLCCLIPWGERKYASLAVQEFIPMKTYEEKQPVFNLMVRLLKGIRIHGQKIELGNLTIKEMMNRLKPTFTGNEAGGMDIELKELSDEEPPQGPSIIGKEDVALSTRHHLERITESKASGGIIDALKEDRQFYRQGSQAEWKEKYGAYISHTPNITISGKKFVFTGCGILGKEHPDAQRVVEQGGLWRDKVSGVTDYLVVGDDGPGESKINAAIAQQKAGKPIQIIRLADLEDAMNGTVSSAGQYDAQQNEQPDFSAAESDAPEINLSELATMDIWTDEQRELLQNLADFDSALNELNDLLDGIEKRKQDGEEAADEQENEPSQKTNTVPQETQWTLAKLPEESDISPADACENVRPKKEGCYIATAVYGSYDAPQVLVLRRFRDERLQKAVLGRWFIRVYYCLSPAIADRLRYAKRWNGFVRRCLDRWVRRLEQ